ncbi:SLBB domain-containing protein [Gammaproteobacteria bacterium]|nr:SLBB domain-containing protein [Gammaproteobacteria bacterium]
MKNFSLFALFLLIVIQPNLLAQSLPANISPQMIQQAKAISPNQQQALAKQIGIDITSNQGVDASTTLNEQNNDRFENYAKEDGLNDSNELKLNPSANNNYSNRFGMSIFRNRVSTFSPIDNLPVPDNYKLGAGDQLIIKLLGTENIQLSPTISRDGSIFINQIGDIVLSGLLFDDAVNLIKQRIESALIGVQVFVTMGRIKTINVFISGEVAKPGMYALSALTSVTQSLYQAGGITEIGSLRNVQVLRNGEIINEFDAYDLLIYGNSSNDIRLRSDDVLFVPTYEGIVTISGNVKRENTFEIKQSDTYADLLKWAGGYDADANPEYGVLVSSDGIGSLPNTKTLNFNDPINLNIKLKRNDQFIIPSIGSTILKSITVSGAVTRPGIMGWFNGIRLSDVFIDIYEDFIPEDIDFNFSFIERYDPDTFLLRLIKFSPLDVIQKKSTDADLTLQEGDVIHILYNDSRRIQQISQVIDKLKIQSSNDELEKVVVINGAVKFPGEYPIFDGAKLADLFLAAGGFKDHALLDSIEISRLDLIEGGLVTSSVLEVSASNELNEMNSLILQSRDRINVRSIQEFNTRETVNIQGQVKFPGIYPLNYGDTLKSIVSRAGGFIDRAFPEGAYLIKESTKEAQKKANAKLANTIRTSHASSMLTSEDISNTFSEIDAIARTLEESRNDGRIVIDLVAALNGNKEANIQIAEGDILIVPEQINTISVIGEVNSSNSNIFNPALDINDYIALSGGFTKRANQDDIYIIKANGSIIPITKSIIGFGLSKYKLQRGDTIVVPVQASYRDSLGLWKEVTQIIYQSLVSFAALDRITQ